jgi:hypothetical protein
LPKFSGIVGRVEPQWERLGEHVAARRKNRGWSQAAVADRGGPSDTLQSRIEAGEWRPSRGVAETLKKIDVGLEWEDGSASRVLDGGEPTPRRPVNRDGKPLPDRGRPVIPGDNDPRILELLVAEGWSTARELAAAVTASEQPSERLLAATRDAVHFIAAYLISRILNSQHAARMDNWLSLLYVEREQLYRQLSDGEPDFPWLLTRSEAKAALATLEEEVREAADLPAGQRAAAKSEYDLAARDVGQPSEGRRRRDEQDRAAEQD